MDPITIFLIALAAGGAVGLSVVLGTLLATLALGGNDHPHIEEREDPKPPPLDEPELDDPGAEDDEDEEADDPGDKERDLGRQQTKLEKAVDMLTEHVPIARKRRFVGWEVVDQEAIGVKVEEAAFPTHGYIVREIKDTSEISQVIPADLALPEDIFYERMARGTLRVRVPVSEVVLYKPVHEEVYEDVVQVIYILLDYSGSMGPHFPEGRWRPPVWKGVVRRLIDRARKRGAIVILRPFNTRLLRRYDANGDPVEYIQLMDIVAGFDPDGGTNLHNALNGSAEEITGMEFDEAVICMVSDGEDDKFDPEPNRALLDEHGISLHVIMLGVNNQALQRAADIYQIIEPDLTVHKPVHRQTA